MKTARDGNKLTLFLEGRIDTNNAQMISDEIANALSENGCESIIFDADKLLYISSAGLRVLLSYRKKYPDLKLVEAGPEVYEILETTGFTELLNVRKKLKTMSVDGCPVIGKGACGTVYRVDDETVVKVYKEDTQVDEVENERNIARKAFVLGIPTAISYDMVKVGDAYATVFEMLDAKSFTELLKEDPDNFESYAKLFTEVIKNINETEYVGGDLPSYKEKTFGRLENIEEYFSESVRQKLYEFIERIPESNHLIHGDYHIGNIMYRDGEPMLIDLDTLGTGDFIFEIANTYIPFCAFSEIDKEDNIRFFGISYETAHGFFDKFLKLYFNDKDDSYCKEILEKAKIIGYLHAIKRAKAFSDKERAEEFITHWVKNIEDYFK